MREPKLFTLEQALELLPVVRELIAAIQGAKGEMDRLSTELQSVMESSSSNGHTGPSKAAVLREQTTTAGARLEELMGELQELGCELKGIEQGLVDFPALRDGRTVYLCWQAGEDTISYWHELDTGFAGRRPL